MTAPEREFEVVERRPTHRARRYVCAGERVRFVDGKTLLALFVGGVVYAAPPAGAEGGSR